VQVFSLQRCHQVTDVGIASISSTGQLRILNVSRLHKLGVLAVKALIATCRQASHAAAIYLYLANVTELPMPASICALDKGEFWGEF